MAAHSGLPLTNAGPAAARASAAPRVRFFGPRGYDPAASPLRRHACLVLFAVIVAVFATLYPSLGVAHDPCGAGECQQATHAGVMDSACLGALCAAAVPAAPYAVSVLGAFSGRRPFLEPRPDEAYLPPDTRPPRPSPGR